MHRLFPFSSSLTTSGSQNPPRETAPAPLPPIDRRQSLDAYRPLTDRLRSHLSQSSTNDAQGSTPSSSTTTTASITDASTSTKTGGGGRLRRSSSASSLHSSGSKGRSKHKLKHLWHRVSGSVTSIPGAFLGGGEKDVVPPKTQKEEEEEGGRKNKDSTPQVIYFMGNRPSVEALDNSAPPSSSLDDTPQPPQSRHAKLLSMVDEGAEDDDEGSSSSEEEAEDDVRSGETTAVNSPAPATTTTTTTALPTNLTQRQTSRYVDPFASPAAAAAVAFPNLSVPPNSPEAPSAVLPSFGQAAPMSFASFLGLGTSNPVGFFSKSSTIPPTPAEGGGGEKEKVDPETLAQRIQQLIDALPPPPIFNEIPQTPYPPTPYPPENPDDYPASPFPSRLPPPPKPRVPKRDMKTGRPIPPLDAVPDGVDQDVVKLLWSVSVMGDQPLPSDEGGGGGGKDDNETPTPTPTPTPLPDNRRRPPPPGTPRRRVPRSPANRYPRTPRNIWQILEGYNTSGHIPSTPYTGIGSGGGGAPGSVIPLPPVEEDENLGTGDSGLPVPGEEEKEEGEKEEGLPSGGGEEVVRHDNLFSDGGSVMLYSPLIPGLHDLVEMGEVVDVLWEEEYDDEDEEQGQEQEQEQEQEVVAEVPPVVVEDVKGKGRGWGVASIPWFSSGNETKEEVGDERTPSPTLSAYGSPTITTGVSSAVASSGSIHKGQGRTTEHGAQLGKRVKTRRVVRVAEQAWTPSKDKMSIQVFWWGYRLCLPPPTLAILSDKTIEATKRAAMITTALTWFLQNVPVTALPLPLQPTVLLLQRLAPYLGYVGTFISWSWQQVKSYDKGKGVLLTATWLLPIALIPGTWFDHSFPEPPPALPAPAPVPAPTLPAPTPPPAPAPPVQTPTPNPSTPNEETTTPIGQPPVQIINPTGSTSDESTVVTEKRTRKTSLTQTIASFVSRKAKIPSRSRKNSTTTTTNEATAKPVPTLVSRVSSTSTSMTSPMVSVGGLPPASRTPTSSSSLGTRVTVTDVDGEDTAGGPVVFPSGGAQSFAALAESQGTREGGGMSTPMPPPTSAGFVASGMLSPLTPGLLPPTPAASGAPPGSSYLPSPPDSPPPSSSSSAFPQSTSTEKQKGNKLKKRNSLSAQRPETTRKPTLGMNAVHPDSELGVELVKSWRVGTVELPVSPSLEAIKMREEKDEGKGET